MITLNEAIKLMETKFPTLQEGNEETGYFDLEEEDYNLVILSRAEAYIAKLQKIEEENQKVAQKTELLNRLGITEEEAKLLLS
jgi:hypothetical protein